jgi:hypothetical protein
MVGMALACLVVSATGCKSGLSVPGMSWLGWGSQPAPTQLSSAVPRKPSSGALPSPAATTASAPRTVGGPSFASSPGGSNPASNQGYFTGPYRTSQAGGTTGATNNTYPGTTYPNGNPVATRPAAGYQSPYQSPTTSPANSQDFRVADARNGGFNVPNVTIPRAASTSPATSGGTAWQPNPLNATTGTQVPGQVAPTGYGEQSGNSYPQTGQRPAPQQYNPTGSAGSQTGLSQREGPYRPGSTARDTGTLGTRPATSTGIPATSSNYGGSYQPAAPAQTPPSGYAYPTTGQ